MITLLDWVPAWTFLLIHTFITFEQGVRHDRNREAEEACAHTEDATGATPSHTRWPADDTQGRPRTGPRAVDEHLPILAHRLAICEFAYQGVVWRPLTRTQPFGAEADAVCEATHPRSPHPVPTWGCTCGFYAVPSDVFLPPVGLYVDLEVMLTGDIIIHDKGYRAAHQTVLSMLVPNCFCGQRSQYVTLGMAGPLDGWACSLPHAWEYQVQSSTMTTTSTRLMLTMQSGEGRVDPHQFWTRNVVSLETLGRYCPVPIRNH